MGALLIVVGAIIACIGGLWLLVEQFKEGVLWGVGALLLPLVTLVFIILHWQASKRPFLIEVVGLILMVIGVVLSAEAAAVTQRS